MRNLLLATAALSVLAAPAMAQSFSDPTYYGNLGYSQLDGSDGDLGAVTLRGGAKFTPNFGAELETSFGVHDDDATVLGIDTKVEHVYDVAGYGVATFPLNPNFDVFARVGYGVTEIKASAAGIEASDHLESVNYGAGVNYYLDGQNGLRADWTRRDFQDDGGEADVYSLSYVRRF